MRFINFRVRFLLLLFIYLFRRCFFFFFPVVRRVRFTISKIIIKKKKRGDPNVTAEYEVDHETRVFTLKHVYSGQIADDRNFIVLLHAN